MIIEGKWERIDPSKPKSKSEAEAKAVKVEPVETSAPSRPPETPFTAAVDAYFEQIEKADADRAAAADQQSDAFREKLAELKAHLKDRGSKS